MPRATRKRAVATATRHPHAEAARLAGELFGKILDREADPGGYAYALYCLESGIKSVQDIVLDFIASDEFIDRFASKGDLAETVNLVNKILLGEPLHIEAEIADARREFLRAGLRSYAGGIVKSPEYQQAAGPDRVPGEGH